MLQSRRARWQVPGDKLIQTLFAPTIGRHRVDFAGIHASVPAVKKDSASAGPMRVKWSEEEEEEASALDEALLSCTTGIAATSKCRKTPQSSAYTPPIGALSELPPLRADSLLFLM